MNEHFSALVDGEAEASDERIEISSIILDKSALQTWHDYQTIGDAMRGYPKLDSDLTLRIMQSIELEPTVLAPNAMPKLTHPTLQETAENASNISQIVKKFEKFPVIWSVAASCAAVLAVSWVLFNQQLNQDQSAFNIQASNTSTQKNNAQGVVATTEKDIKDSTKNSLEVAAAPLEYLQAHHVSAPSVGSYYIQSASFSE